MNRKGFTLIELLAVILILGIIAIIAIPIVSKIIKESKKSSFEVTVNNVLTTIENTCLLQKLKGEVITSTYTFDDGDVNPSLNIKGKLPSNGTITVNSDCLTTVGVKRDSFTAIKEAEDDKIVIIDGVYTKYEIGSIIYFNPETGKKCTIDNYNSNPDASTNGNKSGCMKWFTLNDNEFKSNVNLLLDHNTSKLVGWNTGGSNTTGPVEVLAQLKNDTSSWTGVPTRTDNYTLNNGTANYTIDYSTYKARLLTANEVALAVGKSDFDELLATNKFWFDNSAHSWLFNYTISCSCCGCSNEASGTFGYWTSTAVSGSTTTAWTVFSYGFIYNNEVSHSYDVGIRPVITVSKNTIF